MFDPAHARYMLTLIEGSIAYMRERAVRYPEGYPRTITERPITAPSSSARSFKRGSDCGSGSHRFVAVAARRPRATAVVVLEPRAVSE